MSIKRHKSWSHDKLAHPKSPAGRGGPGGSRPAAPHGIDPLDEFTIGHLVQIGVLPQVIPREGIPDLVQADGADIGELFEPGSVDRIVGNRMAPGVVNWSKAAPGAFRALKSGGTFRYSYQGANKDALVAAQELRKAGFVNLR